MVTFQIDYTTPFETRLSKLFECTTASENAFIHQIDLPRERAAQLITDLEQARQVFHVAGITRDGEVTLIIYPEWASRQGCLLLMIDYGRVLSGRMSIVKVHGGEAWLTGGWLWKYLVKERA